MQKIQNGFKIVYQKTKNNPLAPFESFTFQSKDKKKAAQYAEKFTAFNGYQLIEVKENF